MYIYIYIYVYVYTYVYTYIVYESQPDSASNMNHEEQPRRGHRRKPAGFPQHAPPT